MEHTDLDNSASYATVAKYLRSSASEIKVFEGVMAEKRVDVFKGIQATKALLMPAYQKLQKVPPVASKEDAQKLLQELQDAGYFLRARSVNNTKFLQPDLSRTWSDEAFYAWVYRGSQITTILGGIGLLLVSFAFVMYPLWPATLRNGTWYILMFLLSLIGLLIVISIIRLIVFGITYFIAKPGIWIFPNLYEDVSFIDSFIPLWGWHESAPATGDVAASAAKPAAAPVKKE